MIHYLKDELPLAEVEVGLRLDMENKPTFSRLREGETALYKRLQRCLEMLQARACTLPSHLVTPQVLYSDGEKPTFDEG